MMKNSNTIIRFIAHLYRDLKMHLPRASNNVLSSIVHPGLQSRVRLRQPLQALNKFGQIRGVLHLDRNLKHRRDRKFHDTYVVRSLRRGDRAALQEELIHAD